MNTSRHVLEGGTERPPILRRRGHQSAASHTECTHVHGDRVVQRVELAVEAPLQQLQKVPVGAVETVHGLSSGAAIGITSSLGIARCSSDPGRIEGYGIAIVDILLIGRGIRTGGW